jgi:hypothetical protein
MFARESRRGLSLCLSRALIFIVCAAGAASAQTLDVKISIVSITPPRAHVEGRRAAGAKEWSFRNIYAGVAGLAERVENLALADESGAAVAFRQVSPGELAAERPASRFSYDLKLDPPAFVTDAAHVSWLTSDRGLLMLGDILPSASGGVKVGLTLPQGWSVEAAEARSADATFAFEDEDKAVLAVGRDVREKRVRAGGVNATLAVAGDWAFTDEEAAKSVEEILKIHEETVGGVPRERPLVVVFPLPGQVAGNLWSAETRGSTVVLLSGRVQSKLAAQAQLDGSLTHELFHLWVPNSLALEGEYDWFYEGFTNYMALRAAMRRGQLTFNDYLNTLGREYDSYRSARGAKEITLPEASQRRWAGSTALVYHKGMLVAYLYDLALMRQSGGRSSLADVYRELFRRYGQGGVRTDGNRAVINALGEKQGMRDFVSRYVEGDSEITLEPLIEDFGLRVEPGGARTHVGVVPSPDRARRELLRKLGYNESLDADERKLHERLKKSLPQ